MNNEIRSVVGNSEKKPYQKPELVELQSKSVHAGKQFASFEFTNHPTTSRFTHFGPTAS
jgi:hypothetical protein